MSTGFSSASADTSAESACGAGVLLVAVERRLVGLLAAIEDGRDGDEALDVGLRIAADLELEPAVPVARDDLGKRIGQAVVELFFCGRHRVEQADGMPGRDGLRRTE